MKKWPIFYSLTFPPHLAEKSPFVQGKALDCCWDLGWALDPWVQGSVTVELVKSALERSVTESGRFDP